MIATLWILGALFLLLLWGIVAIIRRHPDATEADMATGLVVLILEGLALLTAALWLADLLLYLCVHP